MITKNEVIKNLDEIKNYIQEIESKNINKIKK
jgi:hypothetical protein